MSSGEPVSPTTSKVRSLIAADRPATFTSLTRASTAPAYSGQVGFETDTGLVWRSTGTSAGNWAAPLVLNRKVLYSPWCVDQNTMGAVFANGTSANAQAAQVTSAVGFGGFVSEVNTGTTTTGGAIRSLHRTSAVTGIRGTLFFSEFSFVEVCQKFFIPTLSDGTNTFELWIGFGMNAATNASDLPINAVAMRIQGSTATLVGRSSSTNTTNGSATIVANTVYDLVLRWNISSGTATATLNGSTLGTLSTGLPVPDGTNSHLYSAQAQIVKSAGTTARLAYHGSGYFLGVAN